jgi:hypothetical protein
MTRPRSHSRISPVQKTTLWSPLLNAPPLWGAQTSIPGPLGPHHATISHICWMALLRQHRTGLHLSGNTLCPPPPGLSMNQPARTRRSPPVHKTTLWSPLPHAPPSGAWRQAFLALWGLTMQQSASFAGWHCCDNIARASTSSVNTLCPPPPGPPQG